MRMRSAWMATCVAMLLMPAVAHAKTIGTMTTAEPISEARIAALPVAERAAWRAYLKQSRSLMVADKAALAAERAGGVAPVRPPNGPSGGAGMPLDRPAAWYGEAEARRVADTIVSFQTPAGGWGKNVDRTGPPRQRGQHYVPADNPPPAAGVDPKVSAEEWNYVGTIDNNATTSELSFLARVQAAAPGASGERYRAALLKGLRYLLNAQFPGGGWPQVYPLQGGYHDALTFNDDAVSDVVALLAATGARQGDYAFVPAPLATEAGLAVAQTLKLIQATQVVIGDRRTIWGQQYDALTHQPVGARNFEPASLSSQESAGLLLLLMRMPSPSAATVTAVRDGIAWLKARELRNVEWAAGPEGRRLTAKPGARPIWSRYYDMATERPIFGDRDKSIHDDVNELSLERRNGYSWFSTAPHRAIERYDAWVARPR